MAQVHTLREIKAEKYAHKLQEPSQPSYNPDVVFYDSKGQRREFWRIFPYADVNCACGDLSSTTYYNRSYTHPQGRLGLCCSRYPDCIVEEPEKVKHEPEGDDYYDGGIFD